MVMLIKETKLTTLYDLDPDLVNWSEGDPDNPKCWSCSKKCIITLVVSILGLSSTFASAAPSSAIEKISEQFKVSETISALITSLYLCGYIAGPLIWAPLSEMVGRRPIFIITLFCYSIFQLGDALNTNIVTILISRFFSGFFATAPLTNSGGVFADIWDPFGRAISMTLFTTGTFIGPALGPVVGYFVASSSLGYRWIFWIMMIFGAICFILALFFLPETFSPVLLSKKAKSLRLSSGNQSFYAIHDKADFSAKSILRRTILRPIEMTCTEPILFMVNVYMAITYGLMYALLKAVPVIWTQIRGFKHVQMGLIFFGITIGAAISAFINLYLIRPLKKLSEKWHGHPPCEFQLRGAMVAGPFLTIGIFWLGWTGAYAVIPWYVPAIATIFIGIAFNLLFISLQSYLIEVYSSYSASALASTTFCRSFSGVAFPLFTGPMLAKMGTQWALTLIGCLSILVVPSPFFFHKYGTRFRKESKFAPAIDLKLRHLIENEANSSQRTSFEVDVEGAKKDIESVKDVKI
ncbi:major facilitator superfamily domain-containing protein [Phakopsora pachyrhizi]|uniref:Major facilitator superfamily domain-containing protein n=1 Tax=Phakopsora pachyrhizi TaxID=170000 RepID=A0AAV0BPI0_PHAPC|nr:major facilitator superfamily domain-containing protein [Phakopsora pachyrhizi]CAH7688562.1 major facilitator superfamily domain-containing protein [Phakopsora pachyrhizi]